MNIVAGLIGLAYIAAGVLTVAVLLAALVIAEERMRLVFLAK